MRLRDLFDKLFGKHRESGWRLVHETGVRFPDDVHNILVARFHEGYHSHIERSTGKTLTALTEMNIALNSELAHLYLNYGANCARGWYELNEVENLNDCTDYAHTELQLDTNFLALTSIEGQGIVLYDRSIGNVYDVGFGEFDRLRDGGITPLAESMSDFIRWCKKQDCE